jgi:hypothetical protein
MNLAEVMQQVADQLDTIDGLRVFGYPPDAVDSPAGIVSYPDEIVFDQTYGRGMDRITLPVFVVVARVSDRATREHIGRYVDGSGASSVKAVVEGGTYTAFDSVRVTGAEFDVVSIGGTEYLSARFTLDIAGKGAV